MHAFLIDLEGYIYTTFYLFTNDPFMGCVMFGIFFACMALLVHAAMQHRHSRNARAQGHDSKDDESATFADSDDASCGRTRPLFTGHSDVPGAWNRGKRPFMGRGSSYEPPFNVDGTPMIPGSGIDINGNPYGIM